MQVEAVELQPALVLFHRGQQPLDVRPEARSVVHLREVSDLVRGDVIEDARRRQDEAPGERQHPGRRARAPAGRLVADGDALGFDAEGARMYEHAGVEIAARFFGKPVTRAAAERARRGPLRAVPAALLVACARTTPPAARLPVNTRLWNSPRRGISAPSVKGTGCGMLLRRSRTHSMLRSMSEPASPRSHCTGSVTITARRVRLTRNVNRRAPGCRRTSTGQSSSSMRGRFNASPDPFAATDLPPRASHDVGRNSPLKPIRNMLRFVGVFRPNRK